MRTPEQIANLRGVLTEMYGPYGLFLTDEQVNSFADTIQFEADNRRPKFWIIKIRLKEDLRDWLDIPFEEIKPVYGYHHEMLKKFKKLFEKYPLINEIQFQDTTDPTHICVVTRD